MEYTVDEHLNKWRDEEISVFMDFYNYFNAIQFIFGNYAAKVESWPL
jgi:hypothetical protein